MNNIPWAKPHLGKLEKKYLLKALESTWISDGEFVNRFETDFTKLIGTKYAITTSSGTAALHLALMALNIGHGDEVIIPNFTFVAPANMTLQVGATPVYVDIDKDTWCIDPDKIEKNITNKTKAIIAVHIYGNVCDMNKLTTIAKKYDLYLIEDVAEATFSKYRNRYAGSFGDISCFSFQATKTITMGEGGAVLTSNKELDKKVRLLRNHGMRTDKRYWHDIVGYNYRLTNLQAALGLAQLENADFIVSAKKRIYDRYYNNLLSLIFQYIVPEVEPVIWAIAVRVPNRDRIIKQLLDKGIETRPGFYPFGIMPLYNTKPTLVATLISESVISLPSYVSLKNKTIDHICNELKELL